MTTVAMPRHPPQGRLCPASGSPVQPALRARYTGAQAQKLQQLADIQTKMIAAQRAQAEAYKTLDALRDEYDVLAKKIAAELKKK